MPISLSHIYMYIFIISFYRLQERVDRMENNMGLIAHKVNDVLVKLDQFEDVTREMSAKMRQLNA